MNEFSIEQEYRGTTYRSRTEARWAMLFDIAGLGAEYEPEGYKLESGWYVPDFWIRDWGTFFEAKPETVIIAAGHYCQERSLAEDLAHQTGCDVLFGCGNPHVTMKLARIPVDGIPPISEWLTDHIHAHLVSKVMHHRFDWVRKGTQTRPSAVASWRPGGEAIPESVKAIVDDISIRRGRK